MSAVNTDTQLDLFSAPPARSSVPVTVGPTMAGILSHVRAYDKAQAEKPVVQSMAPRPQPVDTAGMEPGAVIAMTDFTRAMIREGCRAKVETGGDLDIRKARQCCNALLRGVASDRPEPSVADWEAAAAELAISSDCGMPTMFEFIADDPDPEGCRRRVAAVEERRAAK